MNPLTRKVRGSSHKSCLLLLKLAFTNSLLPARLWHIHFKHIPILPWTALNKEPAFLTSLGTGFLGLIFIYIFAGVPVCCFVSVWCRDVSVRESVHLYAHGGRKRVTLGL